MKLFSIFISLFSLHRRDHQEINNNTTIMSSSSDQARALLIGDSPLKLEYFAIEGVVEQVRIALSVAGVPFDDAHVNFSEWGTKKATTKYGQLPEMTLPDGMLITESMAMLRLAGEADAEGTLYPADIASRMRVEQALSLSTKHLISAP